MPVKTFYAPNLASGLRAVKEAFGEEAVILSTRRIDTRHSSGTPSGAVEIVASDQQMGFGSRRQASRESEMSAAAVNRPRIGDPPAGAPPVFRDAAVAKSTEAPPRGPVAPHAIPRRPAQEPAGKSTYLLPPLAQKLARRLNGHGFEPGHTNRTLEALAREAGPREMASPDWFEARVRESLQDHLPVRPLFGAEVDLSRVLAVTGPSGVGKSSNVAKISSIFWLEKKIPVAIAVLADAGEPASERLRLASQVLQMPFYIVDNVEDLSDLAAECAGKRKLIVDVNLPEMWASGRPSAHRHMVLAQIKCIEIHLTLSGGMKAPDLVATTRRCLGMQPAGLAISKLDETGSVGSVFENSRRTRVPLSFTTHGRRIPEDFANGGRDELIGRVLNGWRTQQ